MKKVLFTATVDSHILQFHLPFLKLFKNEGYEVHVATSGNEEIPYCDVKHVVCFERSPFRVNNLKAIKQLKKICGEEKFDIIHTHTPMGSVVTRLAAKKLRREYNTRVIYTAHGLHFFKGAPFINWLIFYPVEKYFSKYTDTLILINKEDYELCKRKFKKCKDIQYVPGVGINEEKFNFNMTISERHQLRNTLNLNENDFVMIYPAELNANKNQTMIINAVEELSRKYKDIKVLLPGIDSYNGYYQKLVKEKKLEDYIKFLGYRKDIPKLLKISDVALATSKREGLPLNVMEAMYVGLPIIATDCRGQRDLVKNGINGYLVSIDDQKAFNDCIEKLYLERDVCAKFKHQSQQFIDNYLLDNIISKLKKIYFRRKKILHFLASNKFSGAENVVCTIISNMKDYDMYYCSPTGEIEKQLNEKKIKYIPIKKLSYFNIKNVIEKYNPDIIQAHDNKATVKCSVFGKKHIVISHIHGNNKIMNYLNLKTLLFNYATKNIHKIIWVSDSSYNDYYFKDNVKSKSVILYNIVDKKEIINKSRKNYTEKKHDVIFLGRLAYPKDPERFIEVVKLVKEKRNKISVAIVGDGIERQNIEKLIAEYNLSENVTLYGFQTNPYGYLNNSKLLVMTSIYEGTPMCALEAQALGKPIIATPVDGLKKIVKNDVNGYLSNENEILANKIVEYLDENKYFELSKHVDEIFEKINNENAYYNSLDDIYSGGK